MKLFKFLIAWNYAAAGIMFAIYYDTGHAICLSATIIFVGVALIVTSWDDHTKKGKDRK